MPSNLLMCSDFNTFNSRINTILGIWDAPDKRSHLFSRVSIALFLRIDIMFHKIVRI